MYLFKQGLSSGSKTKWGIMGDQTRPSATPPAVLLRSSRPLHLSPCQHEHPAHTQGSCRNYGPLCFEGTPTARKNTRVYHFWKDTYTICPKYNVRRRLTAVVPECFHCEDCQYQTMDSQLVRWHPKEPN